ncbi:MAG: tetratricopeptide repeat protein [Fibromonadaceae bacterium]|jgi:Flp pilus assembly protein TadD|nr:tetratricopeptide repeat protein [Fibromonadaceae bacterium]
MYTITLESLNTKSDLRGTVGAISNVFGIDKKSAVEKAKSLPLILGQNMPEKEARLMADMFNNLGAGIKVEPPLDNYENPIRDFKTEVNRSLPVSCLVVIILCMAAFATFLCLNYEWILKQFEPSPAKVTKLLRKGEISKARRSIQSQLRAKPNDTDLWILLSQYYIMAARKKMNAEQWKSFGEAGALPELDSAAILLRKAEAADPKNSSVPMWLSITEQVRQNLPEAEIAARRAISIDPSNADNWNQLGSVLVDLGNISQAEQAFYNVIKSNTANANALKNLAILNLYHSKDAERAAGFLFAYLAQKESESDVDSHQMRADLATAMIGDFNPPWEKISPPPLPFEEYEGRRAKIFGSPGANKDPLAQEQLGLLFMSKGENIAAEAHFIKAIHLGKSEASRKMLSIIYMKDGNYEKALKIMQTAEKNKAKDPFFSKNIGVLQKYYKADQAEASKAFNRYFALGGDSYGNRIKKEMR